MLPRKMNDKEQPLAPLLSVPRGSYRVPAQPAAASNSIRLSVIVPTYREGKNIGELVARLCLVLDPVLPAGYEIIVVDDDSPDGTWELAQQLTSTHPALRVM